MGIEHAREARGPLEAAVRADAKCQKAQAGLGVVLSQTQEWGLSIPPLEAAMALEPTDEASLLVLVDSYTWTAGWRRLRGTNHRVRGIFVREIAGVSPKQPNMDQINPDNETPTIDFHYPFVSLKMHLAMAMRRSQHYHKKGIKEAKKEKIALSPQGTLQGQKAAGKVTGKLKVIYMSSKFRNHGLSHLVSSMFKHHDRTRFEIICVAIAKDDLGTPYRPRIKATVDHFIEADTLSQPRLAERLQEIQGHVLNDLDGLTRGHKPQALSLQPLPVQTNTMEYPGSIGAAYIQYMTTDILTGPPPIMREGYSEKASYMPWTYFANSYHHHFGKIEETSRRSGLVRPVEGAAVIASSFNQFYKMDPTTYRVWMNALRRSKAGYLWLIAYNVEGVRNLEKETSSHGLATERVIFSPTADKPVHLARIMAADFSVDTLKCNGLTTTTDTLFFSVPGITMPYHKMAERAAASIAKASLPYVIT